MDMNNIISMTFEKALEIADRKETKVIAVLGMAGVTAFTFGYTVGKMVGAFRQREKDFDALSCGEHCCHAGSKQAEMEQFLADDEEE